MNNTIDKRCFLLLPTESNYNMETKVIYENIDQVLDIKDKGVALPNVLNEEECQAMNNGMWDTAEYLNFGTKNSC